MSPSSNQKRILFLYPDPPGFSGQRRAAELMLEVFQDSDSFELIPVKLPGLPKTGGGVFSYVKFAMATILSLIAIVRYSLFARLNGAFFALCQTRSTLVREHVLMRVIRLLSRQPQLPFVYRLDGSNFTKWSGDEPVAAKFRSVLGEGKFVSILGPTQKKIIDDNFRTNELEALIIPNTCEFRAVTENEILAKHQPTAETLKVLHLSSLMEPKGYVEVAESVASTNTSTEFVICGKITSTQYDQRFSNVSEASSWLKSQSRQSSRLQWIEGAFGEEKHQLFLQSHIFVMPTDYPVEAQPLVLLEAMACGCTVVTTSIGEIPYMVDDSCALLLKERSAVELTQAIKQLENDPDLRLRLAIAGRKRFLNRFSMQQNLENWTAAFLSAYGSP